MPARALRTIPITWPFAVWGFDMVGPFRRSSNGKTHLLVMVDKFTKWIEAEPVGDCEAETAVKFLKKVIFRFDIPTAASQTMGVIPLKEQHRYSAPTMA